MKQLKKKKENRTDKLKFEAVLVAETHENTGYYTNTEHLSNGNEGGGWKGVLRLDKYKRNRGSQEVSSAVGMRPNCE